MLSNFSGEKMANCLSLSVACTVGGSKGRNPRHTQFGSFCCAFDCMVIGREGCFGTLCGTQSCANIAGGKGSYAMLS